MWRIQDVARVLAMIGKQDEAIDRLDFLLSSNNCASLCRSVATSARPSLGSPAINPKFQELLANH